MKGKKIFLDTDILLDTFLNREPHSLYSDQLIGLCEKNQFKGVTSALVLANMYYILNKISNHQRATQALAKTRSIINVLPLTDKEIGESLTSGFKDFEDGVQYFIAINNKVDYFITRNIKDFKSSHIPLFSPQEALKILSSK